MNTSFLSGFTEELNKLAASQVRSHTKKDGTRVKGHRRKRKGQSEAMMEQGGLAALGGILGTRAALGAYGNAAVRNIEKDTLYLGSGGREKLKRVMNVRRPIEFKDKYRGQPGIYTPPRKDLGRLADKADPAGRVIGEKGRVWTDPKSTIAAHELGHARVRDVRMGRALSKLRMSMPYAAPVGIGAALLADPDSKVSKYAPAIGGVGAGAMLADEAMASILGDKGMRKLEYASPQVKKQVMRGYRKAMLKGMGSYGLLAAGVLGTPYAIRQAKLKQRASEVRKRK